MRKLRCYVLVRELWEMPGLVEEWLAELQSPEVGCAPCLGAPIRLVWAQKQEGGHDTCLLGKKRLLLRKEPPRILRVGGRARN